MSNPLDLVAVGNVPIQVIRDCEEAITQVLAIPIHHNKTSLGTPTYAFNKDRSQYHCTAIMRRILTIKSKDAFSIMGITDIDVFEPESDFVFGESDRESKSAILSTFRLKSERADILKKRLQLEAVHQAGHLLGLSYCEDGRCVMSLATNLAECDRRNLHLCNNCRNELARIRA